MGNKINQYTSSQNVLASIKSHPSRSTTDPSDAPGSLHKITCKQWCQEFHVFITNHQSFVSITQYCQLRRHIPKQRKHMRSIDEIPPIMGIAGTHANTNSSG